MGITSAAALGRADRHRLCRTFGAPGDRLADIGLGIDTTPVVPYHEKSIEKSISHETTLEEDTLDAQLLGRMLHYLAEQVGYRLRKKGLTAGTVGVVGRYSNLQRTTRSHTLAGRTDDGLVLYQAALPLLESILSNKSPLRLIGITAAGLTDEITQRGLFEDTKRKTLIEAVDKVNEKFGKAALKPASVLTTKKRDHITFKG